MAELGAGNGTGYPGTLDTDDTIEVDGTTLARADVPNDMGAAIVAIQNELGTDPAGSVTDVKTRLAVAINSDGTIPFTSLSDTPSALTGNASKAVKVNAGETALEFVADAASNIGGGTINLNVSAFDTPRATAIGDMTASSGIESTFAGPDSNTSANGASKGASTTAFIGQDWGSGVTKTLTGIRLVSPSDTGFSSVASPNITLSIEGSATGAWGGEETILGTVGPTADSNGLSMELMTGLTATAFRYHRVTITSASSGTIYCVRAHLFTADSGSFQNVGITADNLTLLDSSGNTLDTNTINLNCDLTATGANGRQSGAMGSQTTHLFYAISNGTTTAAFSHLDTEALTLPSGYTYSRLVFAANTNTSSELIYSRRRENFVSMFSRENIATGLTTTVWVGQDVSAVIPTKSGMVVAGLFAISTSGGNLHMSHNGYSTVHAFTGVADNAENRLWGASNPGARRVALHSRDTLWIKGDGTSHTLNAHGYWLTT